MQNIVKIWLEVVKLLGRFEIAVSLTRNCFQKSSFSIRFLTFLFVWRLASAEINLRRPVRIYVVICWHFLYHFQLGTSLGMSLRCVSGVRVFAHYDYLAVCLSSCLPLCISVGWSIDRSVGLWILRSLDCLVGWCVCLLICLFVCLSVCLCACLSICFSVCLSVALSAGLSVGVSFCGLFGGPVIFCLYVGVAGSWFTFFSFPLLCTRFLLFWMTLFSSVPFCSTSPPGGNQVDGLPPARH